MTDGSQKIAADPRTAAERLTAALAAHLAAAAGRTGEHDPAVQAAYTELRAAAADYDDALYDAFGEVTPFDLADLAEEDEDEPTDAKARPGGPPRMSILARWDYTVIAPENLLAGASAAVGQKVVDLEVALAALVDARGHGHLADISRALELGLRWHGVTTSIYGSMDAGPDDDDTEWMEDAFAHADPEEMLCRVDTPVTWAKRPAT
jgi:hypothetical protein